MSKLKILAIMIVSILLFNACDTPFGLEDKVKITGELKFETVLKESRFTVSEDDYNLVINNNTELTAFMFKYLPHISNNTLLSSKVDFNKEMLIIVGCSMRSSGSDYIEVKSVYRNDKKIIVYAKEVSPAIGTADIGYPFHIVKIAKTNLPIEFAKREIIKEIQDNDNFAIPFNTIIKGSHEVISENAFNQVIRTKDEADKFINSYKTNKSDGNGNEIKIDLSKINFDKEMALVVHSGPQSSGSINVTIEKVAKMNGKIYVYSVLQIPAIGTDDIGYPVHIVSIPKYENEVVFEPTRIENLPDEGNANELAFLNSEWHWQSWTNSNGETTKLTDIQFIKEEPFFSPEYFFIKFGDTGNMKGRSGCNDFGANYKADKSMLTFADMFSTKVACFMSSEFMSALNSAYKYDVVGNTLIITTNDPNYSVLTFTKDK